MLAFAVRQQTLFMQVTANACAAGAMTHYTSMQRSWTAVFYVTLLTHSSPVSSQSSYATKRSRCSIKFGSSPAQHLISVGVVLRRAKATFAGSCIKPNC